jgi:hypothetical protein
MLRPDDVQERSVSLPRLRAPREDGAVLAEPPLTDAGRLLADNHARLAAADVRVLGRPLAELRALARREVWAAAAAYAAESGDPAPPPPRDRWLLAGHQPELFHPGVWVKNFALRGLARKHDAFSLNLVVDNDIAKSSVLRLPAGEHFVNLPFDVWKGEMPYEERPVLDEALFASLPERARPHTGDWPFAPMLPAFWAEVLRQAGRTRLLGERFAAARRTFERAWGCTQAEVPLSRVCRTEAFAWFACHLVRDAERFHALYNEAVHDYRRRYDLKSRNHPVPDLARDGDWLELPLWAWCAGQTRRGRLFVRTTRNGIELRAGDCLLTTLPDAGPEALVAAWRAIEPAGCKLRTRALTTTLFARACLGDLFIHGIGGGKYDELTDVLIDRFLGLPPPALLVLSATLLLPFDRPDMTPDDCRRLATRHRDVWYNPQRHLPGPAADGVAELVREKERWIRREAHDHRERVERFHRLRDLTRRLRPFVAAEEARLREAQEACGHAARLTEILTRRDYAFPLFPEGLLRDFFRRFL